MLGKCYASELIKSAVEEIGYHEKATNSQLESKLANSGSGNWTKYAKYINDNYPSFFNGNKNGYAWCAVFVVYNMLKTFGLNNTCKLMCCPAKSNCTAGAKESYMYYKRAGQSGTTPKVGAQVFFGDSESTIHHTGLVENFDANYVYTIEGNTSNQVARRTYKRKTTKMFFGYPGYDTENKNTSTTTPMNINIEIPINNTKTMSKEVKATGRVISDSLNVRSWAGSENALLKSIPQIHKGTIVQICDALYANDKKSVWYYVLINNKTYGFVSSKYIELIQNNSSANENPSYAKVEDYGTYSTR